MAKQTINVGITANDNTGDTLRVAFTKVNSNFTELYANDDALSTVAFSGSYTDLLNVPTNIGASDRLINGTNQIVLGTDGTTKFPTLTVPISDNANPSGTGQTLKFSDATQQAIIYGPPSTVDYPYAERVIIQGAPGYTGTAGEGGDVYLWAGPGGDLDGGGGDIKVRAGRGSGSGQGGYLNFQAGGTVTGYGGYINIESGSSGTTGQGGYIGLNARSGGNIDLSTNQTGIVSIHTNGNTNNWLFGATGDLTFPDGSIQNTAFTGTGTGTVDNNIWIETFTSDAPATDFVQSATSVEYDTDGNIIALFNHYIPTLNNETYTSVAKLTPTGAILWQMRFANNLNTDGWGLAYDTVNNFVYVAGKTSGAPLTYEFATLTKLNGFDGTVIWSKTYDFEANSASAVVDVASDGNPVMVGYAYNGIDNYIVTSKINNTDGSVLWSKTLNGQGDDEAYGMAVGPAGEVVTIGYIDGFGVYNAAATVIADPASNVNWTNERPIFNGGFSCIVSFPNGDGIPLFSNIEDTIGNRAIGDTLATVLGSNLGINGVDGVDDLIIKVDTLAANDDIDRMVVIKYYADGTIDWQKAIQFDVGYDCSGADADIDADGNIYVCGQYRYDLNPGTTSAMSLVKFNSLGDKQWSRRVVGNCDTFATSVVVGTDNHLYLSGITLTANNQDYIWAIAKYDTLGTVVWQRLIDNTTTWSFGGSFWYAFGGGSNIAVRNGYIALGGGFGDPGLQPTAAVIQLDTDATPFSVGDWDIKGATFSGLLDITASDITVVNAGKDLGTTAPTMGDFNIGGGDFSNFLSLTRYGLNSAGTGNIAFEGVKIIGQAAAGKNGLISLVPAKTATDGFNNINFENFGQYINIYPTNAFDSPHIHIAAGIGPDSEGDIFLGDDNKHVQVNHLGQVSIQSYNTGTNAVHNWNFSSTGQMTFPQGTVLAELVSGPTNTFGIFANSVPGRTALIRTQPLSANFNYNWEFGNDGILTLPNTGKVAVTGVTATYLADRETAYNDSQGMYFDAVFQWARIENSFSPIWFNLPGRLAYDQIIAWTPPAGFTSVPTNLIPLANACKMSYAVWQEAIAASKLTVKSDTVNWEFDSAGKLTLPQGGIIAGGEAAAIEAAYTAWQEEEAGWQNIITTAGADLNIRPWNFAGPSPEEKMATLTAMWMEQQRPGTILDWVPISASHYAEARAWLAFTSNTDGYRLWKKLTTGVTITSDGKSWTFTNDGALTLPGTLIKSTVAKTGGNSNPQGNVLTATLSPTTGGGWANSTYFVGSGGIDINVTIFDNTITLNSVTSTAGTYRVGDIVIFDGGLLGGQPITDNVTLTVNSITTAVTPSIALDLTKSINKLTEGDYTLANGIEGQIMYLVPQVSVANAAGVRVSVANFRTSTATSTGGGLLPFRASNNAATWDNTGLCTLIFTDGAWQQQGGLWD